MSKVASGLDLIQGLWRIARRNAAAIVGAYSIGAAEARLKARVERDIAFERKVVEVASLTGYAPRDVRVWLSMPLPAVNPSAPAKVRNAIQRIEQRERDAVDAKMRGY